VGYKICDSEAANVIIDQVLACYLLDPRLLVSYVHETIFSVALYVKTIHIYTFILNCQD